MPNRRTKFDEVSMSEDDITQGAGDGEGNSPFSTDAADLLEADLRKLQSERDTLFEQLARVQADFKNAQKRLESDKQQAIAFANSKLITSLLPVIDNFERALGADPAKADVNTLLKGLQIVYDQLMTQL